MVKRRKPKDMTSSDYVISNFAGSYVKWILLIGICWTGAGAMPIS